MMDGATITQHGATPRRPAATSRGERQEAGVNTEQWV
jgi:hypothetical protein